MLRSSLVVVLVSSMCFAPRAVAEGPPGRRVRAAPPPEGTAYLRATEQAFEGEATWLRDPAGTSYTCVRFPQGRVACLAPALPRRRVGVAELATGLALYVGGAALALSTFELDFCGVFDFDGTGSSDCSSGGGNDGLAITGAVLALSGMVLTFAGFAHVHKHRAGLRWLGRQEAFARPSVFRDGGSAGGEVRFGFRF